LFCGAVARNELESASVFAYLTGRTGERAKGEGVDEGRMLEIDQELARLSGEGIAQNLFQVDEKSSSSAFPAPTWSVK
jgi:hypothetical protein